MKIVTMIGLFVLIFSPLSVYADDLIQGHYCYTYGDRESLQEARELTRSLAIRNAIESYRTFITFTSIVKNFQLTNDLIQVISSGYLKDIKVMEHKEDGRTVCERIQATISPAAVKNIINEARAQNERIEERGLANNGYLKILNVRKSEKEYTYGKVEVVAVTARVLKNTGSLSIFRVLQNLHKNSNQEFFRICIEFYDSNGNTVDGAFKYVHDSPIEMLSGQVATVIFHLPKEAKSWRVWLPEAK